MHSIRTQAEFNRVFKEGSRASGKLVNVVIRKAAGGSRLGIVVNKKFGNAVQRNRIKRLIREAFNRNTQHLNEPVDLVALPRSNAVNASMEAVRADMENLISKIL